MTGSSPSSPASGSGEGTTRPAAAGSGVGATPPAGTAVSAPTTKWVDHAPSLPRLYVAALRPARRGGDQLPPRALGLRIDTSDGERLAAYCRTCGFPVADTMPPTWPHVLGFPLQVALMSEPEFPFRMLGLVHLRNVVRWHRPLRADEPFAVMVRAERLAPHPRGATVELVTEVLAGDTLVWEGRSTYLSRGATARDESGGQSGEEPTDPFESAGPIAPPPADAPSPAAQSAGGADVPGPGDGLAAEVDPVATAVWRVPADTGRRYAALSGDVNPIHLSPLTARALGFPRAIAHGMWLQARLLAAYGPRLPGAGECDVAFRKPVLLPSMVRLHDRRRADGGWDVELRSGEDRVHLLGAIRPL